MEGVHSRIPPGSLFFQRGGRFRIVYIGRNPVEGGCRHHQIERVWPGGPGFDGSLVKLDMRIGREPVLCEGDEFDADIQPDDVIASLC
jgi:hypothetical protein